MYRIFLLSKNK
jgi:hypothetical protein